MNATKMKNMFPVLLKVAKGLGIGKRMDLSSCDYADLFVQGVRDHFSICMMVKTRAIDDIGKDITEVYFFEKQEFEFDSGPSTEKLIKDHSFLSLRATVTNRGEIVYRFKDDESRFSNPEVIHFISIILPRVLAVQQGI